MSVRKLKPITPGQRFRIVNEYSEVTTSKPEKSLLKPMKKSGGRNNQGRMTMRYKGGGHKKRYRVIDFKRDKYDVVGEVTSIEYDPNRSAFIALVVYSDNEKRYVIAQKIYECKEKTVNLTVEDISLLKKLIGNMYLPLIVGQAYSFLEGNTVTK